MNLTVGKSQRAEFDKLFQKLDQLIRAGEMQEAARVISSLSLGSIPRSARQPLAKLCRRVGLLDKGIRILFPVIRCEKVLDVPASDSEICEYAVLLSRKGSIEEALKLLSQVDEIKAPECLLYRGFCHISNWDYHLAIPEIEKFLSRSPDLYSKQIGRVNLCASYLALGQSERVAGYIKETIELAKESNSQRLVVNGLEQCGHLYILQNNLELAKDALNQATAILKTNTHYDQLLIDKWFSVIEAKESNSIKPLMSFRKIAEKERHWASVREADLFSILIQFDQKTFDRLYYGTPSSGYKERLCRMTGRSPSHEFFLGVGRSKFCLDLESGEIESGQVDGPCHKVLQLLRAIVKDLYAPLNVAQIFSQVYPQEYYNLSSSPIKIRQLLFRTRKWLITNSVPMEVVSKDHGYGLAIGDSFRLKVPKNMNSAVDREMVLWKRLENHFGFEQPFTASVACVQLNISRSQFHRLVNWAEANNLLIKTGQGKATSYQTREGSPSIAA